MNAPVQRMSDGQAVHWSTRVTRIEKLDAGWRVISDRGDAVDLDLVVVATPAEQASILLASVAPDLAARAGTTPSAPCWTVMLAFPDAVAVAQDCWRSEDIIGWAARNSAKPGRAGPESWIMQAGPDWSRRHVEAAPEWVAATLKGALSQMLGVSLPPIIGESCHRWRFARSGAEGSGALFDRDRRLGLCGDWLIGPRVEAAWLSGVALAAQVGTSCR